jgi:hypothetical protein
MSCAEIPARFYNVISYCGDRSDSFNFNLHVVPMMVAHKAAVERSVFSSCPAYLALANNALPALST